MDRVFFFNLCVQCLSLLSPFVLDHPGFICTETDLSHSNCMDLADSFIVSLFCSFFRRVVGMLKKLGLVCSCIRSLKIF